MAVIATRVCYIAIIYHNKLSFAVVDINVLAQTFGPHQRTENVAMANTIATLNVDGEAYPFFCDHGFATLGPGD